MRGDELRGLRKQVGIRQVEIAEAMGVHRNIVWRWEHGGQVVPRWAELLVKQWFGDGEWLAAIKGGRRKVRRGKRFGGEL